MTVAVDWFGIASSRQHAHWLILPNEHSAVYIASTIHLNAEELHAAMSFLTSSVKCNLRMQKANHSHSCRASLQFAFVRMQIGGFADGTDVTPLCGIER